MQVSEADCFLRGQKGSRGVQGGLELPFLKSMSGKSLLENHPSLPGFVRFAPARLFPAAFVHTILELDLMVLAKDHFRQPCTLVDLQFSAQLAGQPEGAIPHEKQPDNGGR